MFGLLIIIFILFNMIAQVCPGIQKLLKSLMENLFFEAKCLRLSNVLQIPLSLKIFVKNLRNNSYFSSIICFKKLDFDLSVFQVILFCCQVSL
jgi:hypothetical protein